MAPARVRCYRFAEILEKEGYKTTVLSFVDHLGAPDLGGGAVEYLAEDRKLILNNEAIKILLKYPSAVIFMQKTGYHFLAVMAAAAINNNRIILDYDDFDFQCNCWPKLSLYLKSFNPIEAFNIAAAASSAITVSSRELQTLLKARGLDSILIPTGPDITLFTPSKAVRNLKNGNEKIRFWWGGDIWGEPVLNNLMFVLDRFSEMNEQARSNIEVVICGFGQSYERFKQLVHDHYEHKFSLVLLTAIPSGQMPSFLETIDVGLIPLDRNSIFDRCKSPTKMFEVMAMAKPLVAELCGEPARIIDDGINGFLASSPSQWAEKLTLLANSASLRYEMGQMARKTIEREYALQSLSPRLVTAVEAARKNPPRGFIEPREKIGLRVVPIQKVRAFIGQQITRLRKLTGIKHIS